MYFVARNIVLRCSYNRILHSVFTKNALRNSYGLCVARNQIRLSSSDVDTHIEPISKLPFFDKEKGEIIYSGSLANMIKGVKLFSLSTSFLGLSLQPLIFLNAEWTSLATTLAVGGFLNFFIFVTPLLIHFICKKYVTVCYYDRATGRFTATTYTFFLRKKNHVFTAEDVVVPGVPGMFTSIKAHGAPLFMDQSMFYSKEAYIHLMGFDKPIDWSFPEAKSNINTNQSDKIKD